MIRSLNTAETMRVVQEFALQNFVGPPAEALDPPTQFRTALVAVFLAGIRFFRNVSRIDALLEVEVGEVEKPITGQTMSMMHARSTVGASQDSRTPERS